MQTFEETEFLEDFLAYYNKAKKLQDRNIKDIPIEESELNDPLMWNVPIYDTINRRYAGFSNLLENLWYGHLSPKFEQTHIDYIQYIQDYNIFNMIGHSMEGYLYLFLVHRITGSGASFEDDHGYRNTIIPKLVKDFVDRNDKKDPKEVERFAEVILEHEGLMFTTAGNQTPPFPKPVEPYKTGGKYYLHYYAPKLVKDLATWLKSTTTQPIRETLQWILNWHKSHGLKQYKFVLTAFVMDIAEYMPDFVDPKSAIHFGSNAEKCVNIILPRKKGANKADWEEETMNFLCEKVNFESVPMDMEDVCCDYIRYIKEYVSKEHRERLTEDQMKNNSLLKEKLGNEYYNFVSERTKNA